MQLWFPSFSDLICFQWLICRFPFLRALEQEERWIIAKGGPHKHPVVC